MFIVGFLEINLKPIPIFGRIPNFQKFCTAKVCDLARIEQRHNDSSGSLVNDCIVSTASGCTQCLPFYRYGKNGDRLNLTYAVFLY